MSYKITQAEIDANNVKSVVGNTLTGTVTQNKNVFDKLIEFLCGKFNTFVDYVEANMLTSNTVGNLIDLDTTYKENTVGAINEIDANQEDIENQIEVIQKYNVVTADTNGDFKCTLDGLSTLASGDVVKVSFPSAIDNTADARLSIDGGTNYHNIKYDSDQLIGLLVENKYVELYYDGTNFNSITKPHIESTTAYTNGTSVTINYITIILDGKDLWATGSGRTNTVITDATAELFSINIDEIGISSLIYTRALTMFCDGGNAMVMGAMRDNGEVESLDIIPSDMAAGNDIWFTIVAKVDELG